MPHRSHGLRRRWPSVAGVLLASVLAAGPRPPLLAEPPSGGNLLETILTRDPRFAPLLEAAADHRLQVLLGVVEEGPDGPPRLVQHGYRVDAEYFYPASAIKLCAAVGALEWLNDLRVSTGLDLGESTPLAFHPLFAGEKLEERDPTNLEGEQITLAHEIRKLFLVSDNVAFNRLYELAGPDELTRRMERAGLGEVRIRHRLEVARTPKENLRLPAVDFRGPEAGGRYHRAARTADAAIVQRPVEIPGLHVGRGYLSAGRLIDGPMDFSVKNRISLAGLQRALALVARPDLDFGPAPAEGFTLTAAQRELLLEAMSQYPRQSKNPRYDPREYPDAWGKLLLPGLARVLPDERLGVYNKFGRAYGFSVENAYVTDRATGRAFFLTAVLYTNRDGILNDDRYEYEEVADPFFAALGEAVARALWAPEAESRPRPAE